MAFFLEMKEKGFKMKAKDVWARDKGFVLYVGGWMDSDYNKQDNWKSMSGITIMLNEMVV